jgi:predicted amidophosphoribosyltransferase
VTLTVREAAATYERAMRNVQPAGESICATCHTFIDPEYERCYRCSMQPELLDAVVPITYSEHLGQMHTALRNYKEDGPVQVQHYAMVRLASILWLFLEEHERCIAAAADIQGERFDLVATVPSSTRARDDRRGNLRWIVATGCGATADRYQRALIPTDRVPAGRDYYQDRYTASVPVDGRSVLLVDDTWATGGHAQSAAVALSGAGASSVGLVVIGRHIRPDWQPVKDGPTSAEILAGLPKTFDWTTCCVHVRAPA